MCGVGQALQMGFQMMSSAAQSKARIEEQNRQYEANKKAANRSYTSAVDTTSLQFTQKNTGIKEQQLDYDLMSKVSLATGQAQAGASNLGGSSILATLSDAKGKYDRNARRFITDRKNLAAAYEQDLVNLNVTRENQINTVMQGRWTAGDTMAMLAPLATGFSQLMVQRQNQNYYANRMGMIGQGINPMQPYQPTSMGATGGINSLFGGF